MPAGKQIWIENEQYVEAGGRLFRVRNAMQVPGLQAASSLQAQSFAPRSRVRRAPVERPETRRERSVEVRLCAQPRRVASLPRISAVEVYLGTLSVRAKHIRHRTPVRRMLDAAVRAANA
ncbi:MAG TPA: hypothetical protein VNL77_07125 [Roseiflexaceae bacterium]|nr:hypothetical protein [Roseiflexaceae bacterium]